MMREWARRAAALHRELGELAEIGPDPRWWLLAGGAAITWPSRASGEPTAARYVASDAEPAADTFIGYAEPAPHEVIAHAVARAYAARSALRALDGKLPAQPLAVTLQRGAQGAVRVPSELDVAAFAIGTGCWCAPLGADDDRDHAARIVRDLWWVLGELVNARFASEMRDAGISVPDRVLAPTVRVLRPLDTAATPFVTITVGDEPIATARHGHRRAWLANGDAAGPWLGLSSTHDDRHARLAVVSTCHFVVDGFGHALLANEIATRTDDVRTRLIDRPRDRRAPSPHDRTSSTDPAAPQPAPSIAPRSTAAERSDLDAATRDRVIADVRRVAQETARHPNDSVSASRPNDRASDSRPDNRVSGSRPDDRASDSRPDDRVSGSRPDDRASDSRAARLQVPRPSVVGDAAPLGIAWRELDGPAPRALVLAYALGIVLHRAVGAPDARYSPTIQIPVAPGGKQDAERRTRRVVPAIASVRFESGEPERFEAFAARTRDLLAREADGTGLVARMLAAIQAVPAPVAWKRRAVGPTRPRWFESLAALIGGRGCVSRIHLGTAGDPRDAATAHAMCAVSSPARLATTADELGGCVVTVIDHGSTAAITLCGSGLAGTDSAARTLLDDLLVAVRRV